MSKVKGKLTFGLELETPTLTNEARLLAGTYGLRRWHDATVLNDDGTRIARPGGQFGGHELITPPFCADVECAQDGNGLTLNFGENERIVKEICQSISHVNASCGVHLHLGKPTKDELLKSTWEPEKVRAWLALGLMLETKVFDLVPPSRSTSQHCKKITSCYTPEELSSYYPTGAVKSHKRHNPKRYCWLNLIETRRQGTRPEIGYAEGPATGTVEIRLLGNTCRPEYIWAWVRFWTAVAALVAYTPTSLAVLHAASFSTLRAFYDEVYNHKLAGQEA